VADEYPAHHLRGEREEVSAVLPFNPLNIDQAEKSFVDQRRGLEGMPLSFVHHAPLGDSLEFGVENRSQLFEGVPVAGAPGTQQPRDVSGVSAFERLHFAKYSSFIALPPASRAPASERQTAGIAMRKSQKKLRPSLSCFSVRSG
jgi:hypothetical protein